MINIITLSLFMFILNTDAAEDAITPENTITPEWSMFLLDLFLKVRIMIWRVRDCM